jgi:hypothetical protein
MSAMTTMIGRSNICSSGCIIGLAESLYAVSFASFLEVLLKLFNYKISLLFSILSLDNI